MDKKIHHLEMLERAISRNGMYRIVIKCLTMYFVTSILSLYDILETDIFLIVVILPILVLGMLDAYYLQQQRLLSSLFDHVRTQNEALIDFLMSPRTKDFQEDKNFLPNCLLSWSVAGFYLPLAFVSTYDIISYLYIL